MTKTFPEIKLSYSFPVPLNERVKLRRVSDVVPIMREVWKDLEYRESFYVVYMNHVNHVLGYFIVSYGGINNVIVDIRLVLQAAFLANASSMIIMHNHTAGTREPSTPDIKITQKIKRAAKLVDIALFDHIILTPESYFSFTEAGLL